MSAPPPRSSRRTSLGHSARSGRDTGLGRGAYAALLAWLAVLLWLVVISLASGSVASEANVEQAVTGRLPSAGSGGASDGFEIVPFLLNALRKPAHVLVYGVLGLLLLWALRQTWPQARRALPLAAVGLAGMVAMLDEIHQSFEAARTGLFTDVLLDLSAAAVAVWLAVRLSARWAPSIRGERPADD